MEGGEPAIFENNILFEESKQAPSPSKDYVNLKVNFEEVQWTCWRIDPACLRNGARIRPHCKKETHEDFLDSIELQNQVAHVYGLNTLEHVLEFCRGNRNYLTHVPEKIRFMVFDHLELEDLLNLAHTNKTFHKICNSEKLWERIVHRRLDSVTKEMKNFAVKVGWKRVFFTNKLQLRAQIRRHQKKKSIRKKLPQTGDS